MKFFRTKGSLSTAVNLSHYSGGADRIVVIDTETTGLYTSDRVIEIALVTLNLDGDITEVWDTLIHPGRDVSATHIHGISASMVDGAPGFEEIAGDVAIRLNGACLAAHNLPFDLRMLSNEFERLGADLTMTAGLDTLTATSMALSVACESHEIEHTGEHSAKGDALATAELLMRVVSRCGQGAPVAAPVHLQRSGRVFRRNDATAVTVPDPTFIAQLVERIDYSGLERKVLSYVATVDEAVADLHFDLTERMSLERLGTELGLTAAQVASAHRQLVLRLVDVATSDGVVTLDEHDALVRVASALDVDEADVERKIDPFLRRNEQLLIAEGMTIVFTGDHPKYEKSELKQRAEAMGLNIGSGVNKKTDLLAAVDTLSPSGKARKARSYGIPIVSVDDLIRAKSGDLIPVVTTTSSSLKVVTCPDCQKTWTVPATSGGLNNKRCVDCA